MGFQLQELLSSDDASCGPCLDDDTTLYTEFNSLELLVRGKPEQVMGEAVIHAVLPSWGKANKASRQLLQKTKDLRVACYLTQALLMESQFEGLSAGLSFIKSLLETHWEGVHPLLVIDGDDDPDYRINAVSYLDDAAFISSISNANIVVSRAVGNFSLRDYRIANGEIEVTGNDEEGARPELALINAAFMDAQVEGLIQSRQWVIESMDTLSQITSIFTDKLSAELSPQLGALMGELRHLSRIYDEILAQRDIPMGQDSTAPRDPEGESEGENHVLEDQASTTKVRASSDVIASREDVIKQMERICKYYEIYEPSSPVPLVLNRAKKLVTMDFMEIMQDMSPDGVQNILNLAGIEK